MSEKNAHTFVTAIKNILAKRDTRFFNKSLPQTHVQYNDIVEREIKFYNTHSYSKVLNESRQTKKSIVHLLHLMQIIVALNFTLWMEFFWYETIKNSVIEYRYSTLLLVRAKNLSSGHMKSELWHTLFYIYDQKSHAIKFNIKLNFLDKRY